jgi:predicted ATP-grasp superfamily ATP-dependent carboligase
MVNALIANAKSPSSLAMIRSLGKKGVKITGATDTKNDFPLFSKYCTNKIILKTGAENIEGRMDELLNIVKTNHFDVFLPVMSENSLLSLALHKNEFEKYTRLCFPSFDQLTTLNNKATVSSLMSKLGIPCPKTYFVDSESELNSVRDNAIFPLVIKPHRGEGSVGVHVIANPSDLVSSYNDIKKAYGPALIQEFVHGNKYTAVFLLNKNSEVRRFFVHHAIREFPITGGPTCFLESVKYDPIFDFGLKLLNQIHFTGLASMEFIVDTIDGNPKIIDVNPRFYGPLQCAISAGVDLPYDVFNMAINGDIDTNLSYKEGVTCRHLLFEDTKHLISVLRGAKSPKYSLGKMKTIFNYLNFFRDDSYFILSSSDPLPALIKIFHRF